MKKILLTLSLVATSGWVAAQVVCAGVSPAAIQGNYEFGVQAACGMWPGETDDGTWGAWNGGLDFNNPGDYIQGELMLVEDGTPGVNPQGIDSTYEGCNALINNLAGKIAVVYRNTCYFSSKVYYAEQAGAIGVIVINREDALIGMLANTDPVNGPLGTDCHIPAVAISSVNGANIVAEMQNGPVVMFIGNKIGAFNNDAGAVKGEYMISPFAMDNQDTYDGFVPGIQVYNYGINPQANLVVTAEIMGPSGVVYSETVGPLNMASGDTVSIFEGNGALGGYEFPAFTMASYDLGDYTLSYNIDLGIADDFDFDNTYTSDFTINREVISLAGSTSNPIGNTSEAPTATSFPWSGSTAATYEYQSCTFYQNDNAGILAIEGLFFHPYVDTTQYNLSDATVTAFAYEWNDAWVDLNDVNYTWAGGATDPFASLNDVGNSDYFPTSNSENGQLAYVQFPNLVELADDQRYMFCLATNLPEVRFGYDNALNYDANQSINAMPVSPLLINEGTPTWYAGGWNGASAPSIGLMTRYTGIEDLDVVNGSAFPNPTKGGVTIRVDASGEAVLNVSDLSGRTALNESLTIVNGRAEVTLEGLESGVYVFNVSFEDGRVSQFKVVKH